MPGFMISDIISLIILMVILSVIMNRVLSRKLIKLIKKIISSYLPVFIFLMICVLFFTTIPSTMIYLFSYNPKKYLLLCAYIEQIIGTFLLIFYFVTGGIVTYQIIEWDLFKKLNKFFGEVIERGRTVTTLLTLVGVGFIISGLLLQIIDLLF